MTKEMKIHESGERASGRTRTREYAEQIFISILPTLPDVSLALTHLNLDLKDLTAAQARTGADILGERSD